MNFLRTEWIVNNDEELIGRMHTRGKNVRCACVKCLQVRDDRDATIRANSRRMTVNR